MKIKIWVEENCAVCHVIRTYMDDLKILHDVIYVNGFEDVKTQGDSDRLDIMAQLADQNMELPVIEVDGEFVKPNEFIGKMKGMI